MEKDKKILSERVRIGQRIAALRTEKGLTQEELAQAAGFKVSNINQIENGKYSVPFDVLVTIAMALDCKVDII